MDDVKLPDLGLPQDLVDAIEGAVKAGQYDFPNALIGEAVREWTERRANHGYTLAELRKLIKEGEDSGIAEEDGFDFLERMRTKYEGMADQAKAG